MKRGGAESAVQFLVLGLLAIILCSTSGVRAATPLNASSALGVNVSSVSYYTTEQPFINIFKTNDGWITHSATQWDTKEEQYLNLDSNGYPISLAARSNHSQQYSSVGVVLERQGGAYFYPSGLYVVLYDGQGRLAYGLDATLVSTSPGRDVIKVTKATDAGIDLRVVATDPQHNGNYLRNIRLTRIANESALKAGQVFDPTLVQLLQRFRVLRFMDWMQTNGSNLAAWSDRPTPENFTWSTKHGVPLEIAVQLANVISADAWLNVPAMADDNYIRQMAGLIHAQLGKGQKAYIEYSNEVWNGSFPQFEYAARRGQSLWPNRRSGQQDYEWNRNWYGMRSAQICDIWKSVWGADRGRVVCVLGAQAAWTYSATEALKCPYWTEGAPCSKHGIDAVAIAPYFGDGAFPGEWLAQPLSALTNLFASLSSKNEKSVPAGGQFAQLTSWETQYLSLLKAYRLPLIAYEGGQSYVGGDNAVGTGLSIAANRDQRMATAYETFLHQWKDNGGQLLVLYNDVGNYSKYGEWGLLESTMQLTIPITNAPPKWRAVQTFISETPCWWSGCQGP